MSTQLSAFGSSATDLTFLEIISRPSDHLVRYQQIPEEVARRP